ncbi:fibronectin type III domain-containing protein [Streptomyces albidoflavus]
MKLTGKVDVPGLGSVDKRVVLGIGGLAAVFVGWKWWQARDSAAYDPEAEGIDPGMEDPGLLPPVAGAVRPGNDYGLPEGDGSSSGSDSYGFTGKTNSQWTQYAAAQLAQSARWEYTDIAQALGAYLANKALTSDQQSIVQAAIAVAGHPPQGSYVIIPGGDTKMTVAPTGLKVTATTSNSVTLSWNKVAGAQSYRAYRSGASGNVGATDGANNTITISGLQPNTEYSFQVAADSIGDLPGPKSAAVKGKTKGVTLKAPTGVKVSSITKSSAKVSWSKVSGAQLYRIYVNGSLRGASDGVNSSYTVTGLKAKTKYSVTVAGDTTTAAPGPQSKAVSFTTKTK